MNLSYLTPKYLAPKFELISKFFAIATAFVLPLSTALTDVFFIAAVVSYFLAGNWGEKFSFIVRNPVAILLCAFFSLFIIGIFYTTAPLHDVLKVLSKYDKLFFAALLMPLFREEKLRDVALKAFLCAIGIALFLSYLKYFGMFSYGGKYGPVEVFKGHIDFSFLMSFSSYLVALYIFNIVAAFKTSGSRRLLYFLIGSMLFLVLIVYNIFFMGVGRSGYFTFAGLFVLLFLQKMRWRGLLVAVFGVILLFGGAYIFSSVFKERINLVISEAKTYSDTALTSVGLRITFMEDSLRLVKKHPVFGSGTGSFAFEYAKINPNPAITVSNPHNEYLHIGVQFGLLGVLGLLFMFVAQLLYSRALPEYLRNVSQAVVVSIIIGSFANSWLMDTTPGHFYAYFIALTFAGLAAAGQESWRNAATWRDGRESQDDGALP